MKTLMIATIAGWLLLAYVPARALAGPKQRAEDVKWAKKIATEFFERVIYKEGEYDGDVLAQVAGLLNPGLALAVEKSTRPYNFVDKLYYHYKNPKIIVTTVAPNGSEVIFTGTLQPNERDDFGVGAKVQGRDADFVMYVARETERGCWSIRYMRITPRPDTPKNTGK